MLERILCPLHEENTASCVIYPTYAYCYGGCGRIELSEIGGYEPKTSQPRYREDLERTRNYIDSLPTKIIRGFSFPYDDLGYYIVWPNHLYYKRRNWDGDASKYKNPSGHPQPLFVATESSSKKLFLVEGEINSLSVAEAYEYDTVISPGSAGDFKSIKSRSVLPLLYSYDTIVLVVDKDGAGTEAAIVAKSLLLPHVKNIQIVLMEKDANQVLCESGKEALREEIEKKLSARM